MMHLDTCQHDSIVRSDFRRQPLPSAPGRMGCAFREAFGCGTVNVFKIQTNSTGRVPSGESFGGDAERSIPKVRPCQGPHRSPV